MSNTCLTSLENQSEFVARHIGLSEKDEAHMLSVIGAASRSALMDSIVPKSIARTTAVSEATTGSFATSSTLSKSEGTLMA